MTPDFQSAHCKLFRGDCLEIMPQLAVHSVDAVICDPPYETTDLKWDYIIPFESMWENLKRLANPKAAIALFSSQPFTSALVMSNLKMFKYEIIWEKTCPSGIATSDYMPMKYHENVMIFRDKTGTYNKQMMERSESGKAGVFSYQKNKTTFKFSPTKHQSKSKHKEFDPMRYDINKVNPGSIVKFASVRPRPRLHPTLKPTDLMEYLVKTYTNKGDTVLDFTMGSGTTGVAATNTGRKFVGIERDQKYFDIAVERIKQAEEVAAQNLPLEMAV